MNRKIKIGDYCDVIKGAIGIKKAIPGDFPLVVTAEDRMSHNEFQFDCKATIIPLVSSTGHGHASIKRLHYQEGKFALGTILSAVIVRDEEIINPRFLYIYLSYFKDHLLVPLMKGAANVTLSIKKIKELEILLPSIERQFEIIELEKNNSLVENLKNEVTLQRDLLQKLRRSILQEAIQGKLTSEWRAEHPELISGENSADNLLQNLQKEKEKFQKKNKIRKGKKQDSLEVENLKLSLPKTWRYPDLDDITYHITDGTHQTPNYIEKGRIFLSAQNVKPFQFLPKKHKYVSEADYQKYISNRKPEVGDLLVGRVGAGIGETAVIDKNMDFAIYVSLGLIKTIQRFSIPQFLAIVFNSPYGVRYSKGNISSKGGSAGNFNLGRIRSFPVPLPSYEEQKAIVEKVEALMQKCTALEKEIAISEANAQMLMQAVLKEAFEVREEQQLEAVI